MAAATALSLSQVGYRPPDAPPQALNSQSIPATAAADSFSSDVEVGGSVLFNEDACFIINCSGKQVGRVYKLAFVFCVNKM